MSYHCVFSLSGKKLNGLHEFERGSYGLAEYLQDFKEKMFFLNLKLYDPRLIRGSYRSNTSDKTITHTGTGKKNPKEVRRLGIQGKLPEDESRSERNKQVGSVIICQNAA